MDDARDVGSENSQVEGQCGHALPSPGIDTAVSRRWRHVGASVVGSAHGINGAPCQDAHVTAVILADEGPVLAIAVGDGAGSAARSEIGSQVACEAAIASIGRAFGHGAEVATITVSDVEKWFLAAQGAVSTRAQADQGLLRDYRTTLLLAVVGPHHAVYGQIGDGAIVVGMPHSNAEDASEYRPIFWPDNGEYANTTFFITDAESLTHLQVRVCDPAPDEVAVLSDGLQMLALSYHDRRAHSPFFRSMFGSVRGAPRPAVPKLRAGLESFLASERVLARTDDDKTLVLATRVGGPSGAAVVREAVAST